MAFKRSKLSRLTICCFLLLLTSSAPTSIEKAHCQVAVESLLAAQSNSANQLSDSGADLDNSISGQHQTDVGDRQRHSWPTTLNSKSADTGKDSWKLDEIDRARVTKKQRFCFVCRQTI